jgi:hypothetical protein
LQQILTLDSQSRRQLHIDFINIQTADFAKISLFLSEGINEDDGVSDDEESRDDATLSKSRQVVRMRPKTKKVREKSPADCWKSA